MKKIAIVLALFLALLLMPDMAMAAGPGAATAAAGSNALSIDLSGGGMFTDRMLQIVALITILSLAPSILIMMTCFTRIVVVLSLLRTAMGTQTSPPNAVIVSLAMFLTLFVMTPTMKDMYSQGIAAAHRPADHHRSRARQSERAAQEIHAGTCARRGPEAVSRSRP